MLPTESLLDRVEAHLASTGIPASRFGKEAVGDPSFVSDLRGGREPRSRVAARVLEFIEARQGVHEAAA